MSVSRELMMLLAWLPAIVVGLVALAVLAGFVLPPSHPGRHRGGGRVHR